MSQIRGDGKHTEYVLLKLLTEGKILQASVPDSRHEVLEKAGLSRNAIRRIKDLENRRIIVGYTPVLSEEGKRYFDALREIYGGEIPLGPDDDSEQAVTSFPIKCAHCGFVVEKNGPCPGGCGYSY